MSFPRFLIERIPFQVGEGPTVFAFPPEELRHLRVARIRPSEHIALIQPDGVVIEVEFHETIEDGVVGRIVSVIPEVPTPRVTLYCGVSKGDRMDLSIRLATELGVPCIVPFLSSRTIVRFEDASKAQSKSLRWTKVALAAAKQSSRTSAPVIEEPLPFSDVVRRVSAHDLVLVAWEEQERGSLRDHVSRALAVSGKAPIELDAAIIVGPEGGLSSEEVDALSDAGAYPITLGTTILRSETACAVASALLVYELGGLGNEA